MSLIKDTVVMLGGCLLFTAIGLYLVRRFFHRIDFKKHHEIAGYLLAVIGTMYSVLLGLIVVNVQTKFDQARLMAETEANCCSDIYNLTRGLPEDARLKIRTPLSNYYVVVQSENWEAVSEGTAVEGSVPAYQSMWRAIAGYQPIGNRETSCYQTILQTMKELSDARRFRIVARRRGLSPIIWCVLIVGAALTILFTFFFWVESTITQVALTIFVALFISLNLLLVKLFENPYRSELMIKHGAFGLKASVFTGNKDDEGPGDKQDSTVLPKGYDPVAK
jgi:Protein of unknown function (DUF4239)